MGRGRGTSLDAYPPPMSRRAGDAELRQAAHRLGAPIPPVKIEIDPARANPTTGDPGSIGEFDLTPEAQQAFLEFRCAHAAGARCFDGSGYPRVNVDEFAEQLAALVPAPFVKLDPAPHLSGALVWQSPDGSEGLEATVRIRPLEVEKFAAALGEPAVISFPGGPASAITFDAVIRKAAGEGSLVIEAGGKQLPVPSVSPHAVIVV